MPRPRGTSVVATAYIYASHGANKATSRYHSGYIFFLNRAPVKWMSKQHQTVEPSVFSSDLIAFEAMYRRH